MKTISWMMAIVMAGVTGISYAGTLCSVNPYTKAEAEQGKVAFDSHCALCHQYGMQGRVPGNYLNESPDLKLLSEGDVKFLDNAGGSVPPLVGEKFFSKKQGMTLLEFSSLVSGAANTFPTKNFELPKSYFQIAAYVLYRNCGKM
jgi:hypothetical protein